MTYFLTDMHFLFPDIRDIRYLSPDIRDIRYISLDQRHTLLTYWNCQHYSLRC